MALTTGTRLGPYEILGAIGTGGMGEVYRARDTRLDRTVALKVLSSELAADPELRARFEREARAIAALSHPHICTVHDVGREGNVDYLVMEHLDGETLAARLDKGPLPIAQVISIAGEIADAFDKVHRLGIVHRDLKPANIMLTWAGQSKQGAPHAKLLDFGLAKAGPSGPIAMSGATGALTMAMSTARGTILGTVPYMSPEQVEGREADARSDIWALGAVIHEMATGKRPFDGASPASIIGAILKDTPPPLSALQPLSPPVLEHVVSTCLEKDPDSRWQSAADVVHELKWNPVVVAPVLAPTRRSLSWMPWIVAGAAVLAAAAAWVTSPRDPVADRDVVRLEVTTPPGNAQGWIALSRDGRQLAFIANKEAVSQVWVRRLDEPQARPITGTDGAAYPFWSHDGRSLGFFADGKLKVVDLPTGAPRVLADAPVPRGGAWNADGVILFAPGSVGSLMRIAAAGGTPEPATLAGDRVSHRWPQFLPDGRRFIFLMALVPPDLRGTYIGSLDSPDLRRVLPNDTHALYAEPGRLLSIYGSTLVAVPFDLAAGTTSGQPIALAEDVGVNTGGLFGAFATSDGGVVAHRASPAGLRQLTWLDRTGQPRGTLGSPDNEFLISPALSPDEQRVAVSRTVKGNPDIWTIDATRGVVSRVTSEPSGEGSAVWARDGRILFHSSQFGVFEVLRMPLAGPAERIISLKESTVPQSLSPDDQLLVYAQQSSTTGSDLWAKSLGGSGEPFAVVQTTADDYLAQLSPDGKWLAYESTVSGRAEVYVQAFPTAGERWQVSQAGGRQPRWSRDGRELFYVAPDSQMMAAAVKPTAQSPGLASAVALFRVRLATTSAAPTFQKPQYDVARDGRFLANLALEAPPTAPIGIIVNWPGLITGSKK